MLVRASPLRLDTRAANRWSDGLTGNPNVARLRPLLSEDRSREEFEASLETLLDRLELNLSQ